MKKGFTLIELLAVIVILAIIALIATPIILGIINDARKESNERSAELYASAVRNAIAAYQLTGTSMPKSFADLDIEYDGNVVCSTQELYSNGSFYIADCTVNGTLVEYAYGIKQELPSTQIYKPQYYASTELFGTVGTKVAPVESERLTVPPTGKNFYLGYDVDSNGIVSTVYVCFEENGTESCLKGYDASAYEINKKVLEESFKDVENVCSFGDINSICSVNSVNISVSSGGNVNATDAIIVCNVYYHGSFACYLNPPDDEL